MLVMATLLTGRVAGWPGRCLGVWVTQEHEGISEVSSRS